MAGRPILGVKKPVSASPAAASSGALPTASTGRMRHRVLIIEARYYEAISDELVKGAIAELEAQGCGFERIIVPGALEIPQVLAAAVKAGVTPLDAPNARFAGAVALGCVIRGDTTHYDTVCNNANHWLMDIATRHCVPVGNGILTVENDAQAMERAKGGRDGKGGDAARACLRLLDIARAFHGQNV
jgi:6,7-dimethyl-8-ribityllumazine synthase